MNDMTEAMTRMIKARAGLIIREPFFGTLAMRLDAVEVQGDKIATTSVDGKTLRFNSEWAAVAPMEQLEACWAHQVLTCALGHPFRRGARDSKDWNDASDYVVNPEITKAGFHLPEGSLIDPQYEGMGTEAIYQMLQRAKPQSDPQGDEGGQGKGSGHSQGSAGSPKSDPQGEDEGDAQGEGSTSPQGDPGKGDDATGRVEDAPAEAGDDQGASEAEMAEQEGDWQTAVAQAVQVAKGCGKLPGGIERIIKEMLDPKVDWREALQRLVRARSKDDYSWQKFNRRFIADDVYLPGMDAPKCGPLAFAIDYSGSIRQTDIDQFTAELADAASQLRPEKLVAMIFDDGVREVIEFALGDEIKLPPVTSGGGTAFDGPVLKLAELEIEPEALVFLTDLGSSTFAAEPEYPVVWVTTAPGVAPYGEIIEMR